MVRRIPQRTNLIVVKKIKCDRVALTGETLSQ